MRTSLNINLIQPAAGRLSKAPALPLELTPLVAEGAIMEPIAVNRDWRAKRLYGACRDIALPSKDAARASLWMEQSAMDAVRNHVVYECHDLRVVKASSSGELSLLVCKRVEPKPSADGRETAPINGFWWSIGGRREIPKPGSPLDGQFGLGHSVLNKANREAGIRPEDVLGIYDLGVGRTEFPETMRYVSRGMGTNSEPEEATRTVQLANPQRTLNRNFVVEIVEVAVVADQTVERLLFMSESEYSRPEIRARFCEYEQQFIDVLFDGWRASRATDTPPRR